MVSASEWQWGSQLVSLRTRPWVAPLVGLLTTSHHLRKAKSQEVSRYRRSPAIAVGRVSARSMAFDSAEEFSWLEGLFDRKGVPELVRIARMSCVGAPLRPTADGGMFV